jgi:hypothetical protein
MCPASRYSYIWVENWDTVTSRIFGLAYFLNLSTVYYSEQNSTFRKLDDSFLRRMFEEVTCCSSELGPAWAVLIHWTMLQQFLNLIFIGPCLYGAEIWMLWTVDQKHLESFEMWCWRRMEKISWTDHVRNEVLLRVKEQRNILHEITKRKANWIGHILRRNCVLQRG